MALVQQSYGGGTTLIQQHSSTTTTTTMNTMPGGGSRLAQMQARFQQKQLQEKEQKLLRMFESQQQKTIERVGRGSGGSAGSSGSSSSSSGSSTLGAGKVRQLFDERRGHKPGWDRSYPLEPLAASRTGNNNGHAKAARGTSLDRTFTVLATSSYKAPGKVPVRRSKSQVRQDVVDHVNNNQEVESSDHNGYITYQSFRTLPQEDIHMKHDDNSNQILRSEMNHVEEMMGKHTLLDNEEPPEVDLVEEDDDEPEVILKVDYEPDRPQLISKLPNVGGPPRAHEEAPVKSDRDRYKTYNASNGHPGQERRGLRADPEPRKTSRDVETKKSREVTRPIQETKRTRDTTRQQMDATRSPPKTPMKSASSRPSKSGSYGSPQPRTPATPPSQQLTSATKKRTPTPSSRGVEPAMSRATPTRAGPSRQAASTGAASGVKDDLVECRVCSRRFAADRVQQHEQICSRTSKKTRKIFDPVKHRVQGTEAEVYIRKIKAEPRKETNTKKADWRRKHEDFIATIRAAKQAQAHLAAGGKVSDLPPPPPSDYSDYVQCPHCSRRFSEAAASRHVPKCATMLHNKPKPAARPAPPRRR